MNDETITRYWNKVDKRTASECWPWRGVPNAKGYGRIRINGRLVMAHRVALALDGRPVPEGMLTDHLCRQPSCVNPAHLEVVTPKENHSRGNCPSAVACREGRCSRGHVLTPENTYRNGTKRRCRACHLEREQAYYRTRRHD